jgi:cytochrome c oxidase subunit 2
VLTGVAVFAPVAALTWQVEWSAVPYMAASATAELAYFALLAAAYRRSDMSLVYPIARGLAPVLVLAALAGYTIDNIPAVKDAPSDAMVVNVLAQQWSFSYVYGANSGISGKAASGTTLVVPENTAVKLDVKSKDVDHDWWVPALGPKIDAIPGQTNSTWFKATRTGTFKGQCAEFCGLGHATMLITVKVVTPAEWSTYTAKLQKT